MDLWARFMIMVFSRKSLCLDTITVKLSTEMRAASKEIATSIPTETTILRDSSNDEGANSDTGFSHGELIAEPSGRESRDKIESEEALARSSLGSELAFRENLSAIGRAHHHCRSNVTLKLCCKGHKPSYPMRPSIVA